MAGTSLQINCYPMVSTAKQYISRSNPGRRSLLFRPIKVASVASQSQSSYWDSLNVDIEAYLKKAIPIRPPLTVFEPMHHLVFDAPPSLAPALCIAACEFVGGGRDQAMVAAAAVRLMHAAACAHDKLLSAHKPISRPTAQREFESNIKLLTGDGIVPFGFELLASEPERSNAGRVVRVVAEIARAVGSQGTVEGQYEEVVSERMERACEKREGELHACAGACGAILGGGSEEEVEKLRKYGLYVGMMQGMLRLGGKERFGEMVERMRCLALNELRDFDGRKIETLSKLVEPDFCCA
uniref:Geranyl pyrophosphate synthase small subunit type I n=1 Tax=Pelargonium graveolens TaxID=73200 RepID=A0A7I6JIF4_9ROSI|nr:geranyl pyrophosphate synthase small subunit type I [Pelargonium graveolens]